MRVVFCLGVSLSLVVSYMSGFLFLMINTLDHCMLASQPDRNFPRSLWAAAYSAASTIDTVDKCYKPSLDLKKGQSILEQQQQKG